MKNRLAAERVIIANLLFMLLTFRFHTATIIVRLDRSTCRRGVSAAFWRPLGQSRQSYLATAFPTPSDPRTVCEKLDGALAILSGADDRRNREFYPAGSRATRRPDAPTRPKFERCLSKPQSR